MVTVTFNPQITYREEIIGKPRPYEPSVQGPKEGSGTGPGVGGGGAGVGVGVVGAVGDGDTPVKPKLNTDLASNSYLNKIKQSPNPTGGKDWWVKTGQKSGENGENGSNGENSDFDNLPVEGASEDFSYGDSSVNERKDVIGDVKEIKVGGIKDEVKEAVKEVVKEVVKEAKL